MKAKQDFGCALCRTMVFKGDEMGIVHHIRNMQCCMICTIAAEYHGVSISV